MKLLEIPFLPDLIAIRRDIHAHPELAFNENRTAEVVAGELERLAHSLGAYGQLSAADLRARGKVLRAAAGCELDLVEGTAS